MVRRPGCKLDRSSSEIVYICLIPVNDFSCDCIHNFVWGLGVYLVDNDIIEVLLNRKYIYQNLILIVDVCCDSN